MSVQALTISKPNCSQHTVDTYCRLQLITQPPTAHIIHLFNTIPDNNSARLDTINHSMRMATNILTDLERKVAQLEADLTLRVEAIKHTLQLYRNIIPELVNATRPEVSTGTIFEENITQHADTDHDH